ncbi:HER171Cp [Eremothecium sinecaudum]|uniref:Lactoylglutathione lyase n=1 Tax=Eremothecium sinecaudum TaxID=45286 RepID=A0A120K2G4_9SACH|nr:HER171Cp [Eremothecium sinecaudum]AMD21450.1 HER171Cp [Eremothecium sinecaudum]
MTLIPRILKRYITTITSKPMHFPTAIEIAKNSSPVINHTDLRIKDPKVSIPFYEKHFGMKLLSYKSFPSKKFDLYYLGMADKELAKDDKGEYKIYNETGLLELTHNYGTESDPDFKINNGNQEPHRGFGHIAFTVADINKECERLEAEGVKFQKRLSDGRQRTMAFALDPDNYWIELLQYNKSDPVDVGTKFNHTMIRIKDPAKSLEFYQNVLGMSLVKTHEATNFKFTIYFVGYPKPGAELLNQEGLIELTHNWGTEDDADFSYHNGNTDPKGYGHFAIAFNNPEEVCNKIQATYPNIDWPVKYNQGNLKGFAFIRDPDGYLIEVLGRDLVIPA